MFFLFNWLEKEVGGGNVTVAACSINVFIMI